MPAFVPVEVTKNNARDINTDDAEWSGEQGCFLFQKFMISKINK
ncbi:hypothetical protein BH11BAC4_BH11BAC4_10690 [soil metagenome]